jgi:predicted DCC family thiol-disulfide oxidoreductase YuxK
VVVVPRLIDVAYHHTTLPMFHGIFGPRAARHTVDHYLSLWQRLWGGTIGPLIVFVALAAVISRPRFFRQFVGPASPGALGVIRMLACAGLLMVTVKFDPAHVAVLPPELRSPMGTMDVLYRLPIGFAQFVANGSALRSFQSFTQAVLFLGMIGWLTRLVIPLGALCFFVLGGIDRQYAHLYHQGLVPLYLMAVLSFTPCGDGWSVDRLWNTFRDRPSPGNTGPRSVYGWSRYACWAVIGLAYTAAGLSKLRNGGLFWWNAANMKSFLYHTTLQPATYSEPIHWDLSLHLVRAPDVLFALLGLISLLAELLYALVLFSRTARVIFPLAMLAVHAGIYVFMYGWFADLALMQFVFFDWDRIPRAIGSRVNLTRGRIEVLYDGFCPLCRRTVRVLRGVDLFERLHFTDFRRLDLAGYSAGHGFDLRPEALEEEMCVISRGRVYQGFRGYRVIALAVPLFWPIAPWLFLPGVSALGALVYRRIATNRFRPLKCGPQCGRRQSPEEEGASAVPSTPAFSRCAFAVSGLIVILLFSWIYRIEYYPLTAWQMFSYPETSGKIEYYKILVHRASGVTSFPSFDELAHNMSGVLLQDRLGHICFGAGNRGVRTCERVFDAIGAAYNSRARPNQRLLQFEIQRWVWDFRSDPQERGYGALEGRIVFALRK